MIRINLLPHRAEKRRARRIQFFIFCGISVVLGALIVGLVHVGFSAKIANQERRNKYLDDEIALLAKQIVEINALKVQIATLVKRKNVVEDLQSTRSSVVQLLDQMLKILPEGVHLKSLKQTGNKISLEGYAQSNARVSTLMRSIKDSKVLNSPELVEIHASASAGARMSEFSLRFNLSSQSAASSVPALPANAATQGGGR
jgi:type IV pilus assembly protein PilN